jgi:hypothetical protein
MERLRMHQLRHPELVTEGMNRLAQALICLTDAGTRAAYDAELGLANGRREPVGPPSESPSVSEEAKAPEPLVVPFAPGLEPPEFGPPPEFVPEPLPAPYELLPDDKPPPKPEPLLPLPEGRWKPNTRRELFAQLALVRRLMAAWQKLKPVLADPREPLARPASVLALLEAVAALQPLLDAFRRVLEPLGGAGTLVLTLLQQRFLLATFRTLLPEQRQALSLDWRRAELALRAEHDRLREVVRSGRPFRRSARRGNRLVRWVARTPEVMLVALMIASLVAAVLRGRGLP